MTAFRPAAFLLALATTASLVASVNALGAHEYRAALTAQAAATAQVAQLATPAAAPRA